jgi:hypothetical protein
MGHRVGYLLAILALAGILSAAPQGQLAARGKNSSSLLCHFVIFSPEYSRVNRLPPHSNSTDLFNFCLAINNDDFNKMYLYAQYAAASYCYANNGNAPNPTSIINCSGAYSLNNGKSNCPDVESNKGKVVKTFTG